MSDKRHDREIFANAQGRRRELLTFLFTGIIGIFVIISFNTSYYKGKFWFPIGVGLAVVNIMNKEKNEKKN